MHVLQAIDGGAFVRRRSQPRSVVVTRNKTGVDRFGWDGSGAMKRSVSTVLVLLITIAILAALRSSTVSDLFDPTTQTATAVSPTAPGVRGLIVLPDDGPDAILDEIDQAQSTIDLYVYLLPADEVLTALTDAHARGVSVRVILERDPFGGGNSNQDAHDRLDAAGIDVRWSDQRFQFSHIKSFVVDHKVAVIMTLNLSWSALTRNREFAVVSTMPKDVAEVSRLFEADWSGGSFKPSGDFVTSPDNSRSVFRSLIDNAAGSIDIYAEVVRDADIRDRLVAASNRGVVIRILVPTSPSEDDLLVYRELQVHGIQVKLLADAYSHAKAIIVDQAMAFVGSQNLTQTSLDKNRECGIVLSDHPNLDRLGAVFNADWDASMRVE